MKSHQTPGVLLLSAVLVLGLTGLSACTSAAPEAPVVPRPDYWPTDGWRTATPESMGFDSAKLAEGLLAIRDDGTRVHSMIAIRDGYVLVETTFYPYDGSTVHDLASVTKSVMTTLIGIAADQGLLDLDAPLVSFFPDRTIANLEARKQGVTLRHLVSLTSGLECDPNGDEQDLLEMRAEEDWIQAALDRPSVATPGTKFVYCGPDMHLLSGVLQEVTGMTALEYAHLNLFEPLGISEASWATDLQGRNRGWGDLRLLPADAAKLGLLFLQGGRWGDRQVVSEEWVREATTAHSRSGRNWSEDYGYGWWVSRASEEIPFFSANGRGGQNVSVFPGLNVIVGTTGGGFDDMADVTDYLGAAIVDLENPLPENPVGRAQLEAAIEAINQTPSPGSIPPLPETARAISGRTYYLETSPMPIESVRLDFEEPDQAMLHLQVAGEDEPRVIPIGLDGVFRLGLVRDGLLGGGRGAWTDADTFALEYDEIAAIDAWMITTSFHENEIHFQIYGRSSPGVFDILGTAQ